jgi:uncharacterized RDD family membrane protein YckC
MTQSILLKHADGTEQTLHLAGLGARAYAFSMDLGVRLGLMVACYPFVVNSETREALIQFWKNNGAFPISVLFLFLIWCLYHPILEWLWKGQTVGKKIAGIQVVTEKGRPPYFMAVFLRNAVRVIDMLPGTYLMGIVCSLLTSYQIRLGDMLAHTWVIYNGVDGALEELTTDQPAISLDADKHQYATELIERWESMPLERRYKLGKAFLESLSLQAPLGVMDETVDKALYSRIKALLR